jgi:hypothetical protein
MQLSNMLHPEGRPARSSTDSAWAILPAAPDHGTCACPAGLPGRRIDRLTLVGMVEYAITYAGFSALET